jgi:hypothetical protein
MSSSYLDRFISSAWPPLVAMEVALVDRAGRQRLLGPQLSVALLSQAQQADELGPTTLAVCAL